MVLERLRVIRRGDSFEYALKAWRYSDRPAETTAREKRMS